MADVPENLPRLATPSGYPWASATRSTHRPNASHGLDANFPKGQWRSNDDQSTIPASLCFFVAIKKQGFRDRVAGPVAGSVPNPVVGRIARLVSDCVGFNQFGFNQFGFNQLGVDR
jgi:hypothetical protein